MGTAVFLPPHSKCLLEILIKIPFSIPPSLSSCIPTKPRVYCERESSRFLLPWHRYDSFVCCYLIVTQYLRTPRFVTHLIVLRGGWGRRRTTKEGGEGSLANNTSNGYLPTRFVFRLSLQREETSRITPGIMVTRVKFTLIILCGVYCIFIFIKVPYN